MTGGCEGCNNVIRTQVIDARTTLPPVLPVVLYNGDTWWTAACSLEWCFYDDIRPGLRAWLPYCRSWLIDEGRLDPVGRQALEPQQKLVAADPLNDFEEMDTMLSERVKNWEEPWEEKGMAARLERGLQKGIEQGLQQGIQEGHKSGEQSLLVRLLTKRFGELAEWAQQMLDAADTAQLESWGEKLRDAKSLQDVFEESFSG